MDSDISWINFNIALCSKILECENKQEELISILIEIEKNSPSKVVQLMQSGDIKNVDPFTFLALIYKYGGERFDRAAEIVSERFKIAKCKLGDSVPRMAQNSVYFDYTDVKKETIKKLWKFFKEANSNTITNKSFYEILGLKNMGTAKLTIGLYYVNPNQYLCLDQATREYITTTLNIDLKKKEYHYFDKSFTYEDYLLILKDIKSVTSLPFYEILCNAWKQFNLMKKKPNREYWLYSPDIPWKPIYKNGLISLPVTNELLKTEMEIGDIIVVKQGSDRILAIGEIVSDYWEGKNRVHRRVYYLPEFYAKTPYKMLSDELTNITNSPEWMTRLRKVVQRFGNLRSGRVEARFS